MKRRTLQFETKSNSFDDLTTLCMLHAEEERLRPEGCTKEGAVQRGERDFLLIRNLDGYLILQVS